MFKAALVGVLRSPASFYDTTPIGKYMPFRWSNILTCRLGRIISRLSKDQDTLDTELSMTLYQVDAAIYWRQFIFSKQIHF